MITVYLFALSGLALITLTIAKRIEEKRRKTNFVLRTISKGDERFRELHRRSLDFYHIGKEKFSFWTRKQLPLRAKNLWYKSFAFVKERMEAYMVDARNSKLLKRSEGISEYFKNMSEVEKGLGEINEEVYTPPTPKPTLAIEPVALEEKEVAAKRPAKPKKPRTPRKKKLTVVESE